MSINEMDAKVASYFELLEQIAQLQEEAEAIKDSLKAQMVEEATESLSGHGWSATWHNVRNTRFDSKRFKQEHPELHSAYTVQSTGTRFTLNQISA